MIYVFGRLCNFLVIPPVIGMILLWDIDGMWSFSDDVIYIQDLLFSFSLRNRGHLFAQNVIMGNSSSSPSQ